MIIECTLHEPWYGSAIPHSEEALAEGCTCPPQPSDPMKVRLDTECPHHAVQIVSKH